MDIVSAEECTKTTEEHDWELLSLAADSGKFMVQIMETYQPCTALSITRGFDNQYFYLMDVAIHQGYLCRVLRLTPKGERYLEWLKLKFGPTANTTPA